MAEQASNENVEITEEYGISVCERFLKRRGLDIIARSWTCSEGRADVVALDGEELVFLEVVIRSSTGKAPFRLEDRERSELVASHFVKDNGLEGTNMRFDKFVLQVSDSGTAVLRHHINAFAA